MAKKNEKMRRVLYAIFFCLLVSSVANAEPARVLWEQVQVMEIDHGTLSENSEWKLLEVTPTAERCTEAQKQVFEVRKSGYEALKDSFHQLQLCATPGKAITVRLGVEPSLISSVFYCLPDTMDPRKR